LGARALDASDRFIYNSNTGALLFDVDGIGAIAPVALATLDPRLALTRADIFVTA
jgi:Ca2+-binding RTX toxin-like protein